MTCCHAILKCLYGPQKYSMRITRQLKRIESITRSPLFAHLSESYTGAAVIRAYRAMDRFIQECEQKVDKNQMYTFACQAIYRSLVNIFVWSSLGLSNLSLLYELTRIFRFIFHTSSCHFCYSLLLLLEIHLYVDYFLSD